MSNTGLEALASIASAAPAPTASDAGPKSSERDSDKAQVGRNGGSLAGRGRTSSVDGPSQVSGLGATAPVNANRTQSALPHLTPQQFQQLQQVLAAVTASPQFAVTPPTNVPVLSALQQQPSQLDASALLALQQLSFYPYLMRGGNTSQPVQLPAQLAAASNAAGPLDPAKVASVILAGGRLQQVNANSDDSNTSARTQVVPPSGASPSSSTMMPSAGIATMPPPPPPTGMGATGSRPISVSTVDTKMPTSPGARQQASIAPHPGATIDDSSGGYGFEDKKYHKRAANRRSAQLSRKRKKQFVEELKDENDDLRRKEQILKSIPDLIVVFDSTGKLWFVSHSVSRFLKFTASELEGTSIWERLCDESVRLLKAAFMDSLALRKADSDTAPLGSGLWELQLVDRDGSQIVVTLNGVVHFAGERPECVCSIRPVDAVSCEGPQTGKEVAGRTEQKDDHSRSLIRVKPYQSVVTNASSDSSTGHRKHKRSKRGNGRDSIRISESGNSSGESETASGSSDD